MQYSYISFGGGSTIGGVERYIERFSQAMQKYASKNVLVLNSYTAIFKEKNFVKSVLLMSFNLLRLVSYSAQNRQARLVFHLGNGVDVLLLCAVYFLTSRNRIVVVCHFGDRWMLVRSRLLKWLLSKISSKSRVSVHALSDWHKRFIESLGVVVSSFNAPTFVAGTDNSLKSANKRRERFGRFVNVIFVGRLGVEKGFHLYPSVIKRLKELNPGVTFSANICGTGDSQVVSDVCRRIEADNVLVNDHGFLESDDVRRLLDEIDLLVYLSDVDAFPLVLLESIVLGVPYVAKISPPISSVYEEYGGGVLFDEVQDALFDLDVIEKFYLKRPKDKILELFPSNSVKRFLNIP